MRRIALLSFLLLLILQTSWAGIDTTLKPIATENFNGAFDVASGDIDGDGSVDVVGAAHYDDKVSWFKNVNGDGLTWQETIVGTNFDGISAVAVADINDDSNNDIIAAAENQAEVAWFENSGSGSSWTKRTVDAFFANPSAVAVGDINGDGRLDIAATRTNASLLTLPITGEVAWWSSTDGLNWTKTSIDMAFTGTTSLVLFDMDKDGDVDVVSTAGVLSDVAWFENTAGNGTAWTKHTIDGDLVGANSVDVGDIDGDGDPDVVATGANILISSNIPGEVVLYANNGDDTWTRSSVDADKRAAVGVELGDLDGDGKLDIAVAYPDLDDIVWFKNTGSAFTKIAIDSNYDAAIQVTLGDLNGDSRLDVIASAGELNRRDYGLVSWWENVDGGTVTPPEGFTIAMDEMGNPVLSFPQSDPLEWVQVWVGTASVVQLHVDWYNRAQTATCSQGICSIPILAYPGFGSFIAYVQPWNEADGFVDNELAGWLGPIEFEQTTPPPVAPTNLLYTEANGQRMISWTPSATSIYYEVWVGSLDPLQTYYTQWLTATDLACGTGTCMLNLTIPTLAEATTFSWYVRSWGPGGFSTGGLIAGWSGGPTFSIPAGVPQGDIFVGFGLGGQVDGFQYPDDMRYAGMTWVKKQIGFSQGSNPQDHKWIFDMAEQRGFNLLIGVVGDKNQLAANPAQFMADYAAYVADLAEMFPDKIYGAIEVWNEPNIEREWPSSMLTGGSYVDMLKLSYEAIKRSNADVMVISAAPAPTGVSIGGTVIPDDVYIQQMVAAGAMGYLDCVGVHYNEGIVPPSATSGDPRGNHYTRYYPSMINLYASTFAGKPLCFTEIGYLTGEGLGTLPGSFSWAANTTLQNQADWLAEAVSMARNGGQVRLFIVWNVDFTNWGTDPMAGWAIIRQNAGCPACGKLNQVMK